MPGGRPPKPTGLHIAAGDPGHKGGQNLRDKAASEPQPIRGFNERPAHLKEDAAEAWDFLTDQLATMQLDYAVDGMALETACVAFATYRKAQKVIDKDGLTAKAGQNGYTMQRPEVAIAANARKEFREFCSHFGLTPAARTRINIGAAKDDELARIEAALSTPRNRTA